MHLWTILFTFVIKYRFPNSFKLSYLRIFRILDFLIEIESLFYLVEQQLFSPKSISTEYYEWAFFLHGLLHKVNYHTTCKPSCYTRPYYIVYVLCLFLFVFCWHGVSVASSSSISLMSNQREKWFFSLVKREHTIDRNLPIKCIKLKKVRQSRGALNFCCVEFIPQLFLSL